MDDAPKSKAEWLAQVERGRATWEAFAGAIADDAWDRAATPGDWSFKDVAAHLNAWRDLTVARLEAAAGDGTAPRLPWPDGMGEETPGGVEEINDWFHERDQSRSPSEIRAETQAQFERIRAAVESIPEVELETRFDWLDGGPVSAVIAGMLEHLNEDHVPSVRAWIIEQDLAS